MAKIQKYTLYTWYLRARKGCLVQNRAPLCSSMHGFRDTTETDLLTRQNPKIGRGFPNIHTRLPRKGRPVQNPAPFRYTKHCFHDTTEKAFADSAKPEHSLRFKIFKYTEQQASHSISLYSMTHRFRDTDITPFTNNRHQHTDGYQKRYIHWAGGCPWFFLGRPRLK